MLYNYDNIMTRIYRARCSSMVEHVPSMCQFLILIPSTENLKRAYKMRNLTCMMVHTCNLLMRLRQEHRPLERYIESSRQLRQSETMYGGGRRNVYVRISTSFELFNY